ncbi:MAG TPA: serine/threonine-protein kinase, partial [Nannocystaceae bacterium]|nr:serine/threonine-protein kinase [Nannocystaceae bacterium]
METRRSVVPFEAPQLVGQLIADRYRVDALLGCGATGAVMRCRHVWLDTDLAVKVLHPRLCKRAEPMRRFEQEARSASRLDHPNCVRVLDFGSWQAAGIGESKYLCMELLWGVELSRLLDHRLGPAFAVDVVGQMLDGLAHAHANGIVHRDIKPQNVVVVAGGASANTVKIVDFGIAKALTGRDVVAERGVCGTPLYMS